MLSNQRKIIKTFKTFFLVVVTISIITGCATSSANRGKLGFDKPKFKRAPAELMKKIESSGDEFTISNTHAIMIDIKDSTIFDENGRMDNYSFNLIKPITIQGIRNFNSFEFPYDQQMMDMEIIYAMVIHPDSTIEIVPDSLIIDRVNSAGVAEMDIYWTNLRMKIVNMPQIRMGDAIAISYAYKFKKPYIEGLISSGAGFQSTEFMNHAEEIFLIPKSKFDEINYKILNDNDSIVKFSEYDWKDYHVLKFEVDSVPPIVPEPSMPPGNMFVPLMLFSNVDWSEYSRMNWENTESPMKITDPELKATVKALVETCKTEYDSARAIGLFVAQDIRYVGIQMADKEGITPHDVNETFKARSGVCKDVAALAVAMLREAGIEAYNVLTNVQGYVISDVAMNQFNHQIALARLKDGREIFIDVTDDVCIDLLPGHYSKYGFLVLTEKGENLKYFPLFEPEHNEGKIIAVTKIDDEGNLTSKIEYTGMGLSDEILRQIGHYIQTEDDRRRFISRFITEIDPNAKLIDFKIYPDPVTDLTEPAKFIIEYRIPEYAVFAGDYLLFQPSLASQVFDLLSMNINQAISLQERNFPLRLVAPYRLDIHETIELTDEYVLVSFPETADINNKFFKFDTKYDIDGKNVIYISKTVLNEIDIPLDNYNDFREAFNNYRTSGKGMLILSIKDHRL